MPLCPLEFAHYSQRLARAFYQIEQRGILVDQPKLSALRNHILDEIDARCDECETILGASVASCEKAESGRRNVKAVAADRNLRKTDVINIGSPQQLIAIFEARGIKIPKKRGAKKNGVYVAGKQSLDEEALLRIALDNQQDKLPGLILKVRELNKMRGTYVDTKLYRDQLFCAYKVTGTETGRRSSQENCFGFGTNGQNIPKHTHLGLLFRECLRARPGHIFIEADQKGAEDWLVQGIIVDNGGTHDGLNDLLSGTNRHAKLAARLFNLNAAEVKKHKGAGEKYEIQYYCGKKTRHAGNYGMAAYRMSIVLLVEAGLNMPPAYTEWLLKQFHSIEPDIQGVFHQYVEQQLNSTRRLVTPLGRERVFFDLRPGSNNADTYRKAYAFIPQSSVGDNTGLAICQLVESGYPVIQDNHDAITLEVLDNDEAILDGIRALERSFDRTMQFPNGTEVKIPLEVMVGYNLKDLVGLPDKLESDSVVGIIHQIRSQKFEQLVGAKCQ